MWEEREEVKRFLDAVIFVKTNDGQTCSNGFKKSHWRKIVAMVNEPAMTTYTKMQLQNKLTQLKKKYLIFSVRKMKKKTNIEGVPLQVPTFNEWK